MLDLESRGIWKQNVENNVNQYKQKKQNRSRMVDIKGKKKEKQKRITYERSDHPSQVDSSAACSGGPQQADARGTARWIEKPWNIISDEVNIHTELPNLRW